jgi:hypothetical protein
MAGAISANFFNLVISLQRSQQAAGDIAFGKNARQLTVLIDNRKRPTFEFTNTFRASMTGSPEEYGEWAGSHVFAGRRIEV